MLNSTKFKVVKGIVGVGAVVFPLANGIIKSKVMEQYGDIVAKVIVNGVLKKGE